MINELTMGGLLVSAAALFVGGFARGLTGFGNAAIIVTSLTFFLPPQQVVPLAIALEVIAGLMLLPSTTGAIHTSTLRTLLLGAALATPFGVLTLELVDADILRGGILLGILAVSVMLIYGITLPVPPGAGPTFAAGTVSGFGNGAAGLSGLPVALFLSARRDEIASLRATVSIYIVLIGMLTLAFLTLRGLVRADTLWATGAALPPMLAGLLLGRRSFNRISPATFRNAVLLLLCLASVLGLLPLL